MSDNIGIKGEMFNVVLNDSWINKISPLEYKYFPDGYHIKNNKINKMEENETIVRGKCIDNSPTPLGDSSNLELGKIYEFRLKDHFGTKSAYILNDENILKEYGFKIKRFEILPNRTEIEIGDIVEYNGTKEAGFNYTNEQSTLKVIDIDNHLINVEILDHDDYSKRHSIGRSYWVSKEHFNIKGQNQTKVEVVKPSEEDVLNSIKVEYSNNNFTIKMLNNKNIIKTYNSQLGITGTQISCGISQMNGLNNLFSTLERFFIESGYRELYTKELAVDLITTGLKSLFSNYKIGFLLMSTNIDNNKNFKDISDIIESFDHVTWNDVYNNNSKNNIRLWTMNLYKYQNA